MSAGSPERTVQREGSFPMGRRAAGYRPGRNPVCEGVAQAGSIRLTSQVVSIIENVATHPDEIDHRTDVGDDRLRCEPEVLPRISFPERCRLLERHLGRDIAGEGVVSRGLVGDQVERLAARTSAGRTSAAFARSPTESGFLAAAAARIVARASSRDSACSSRYLVSSRRSIER